MRRLLRFTPIIIVLVIVLEACNGYESALTIAYAFRKAESAAMIDPAIGGLITDVSTQRKINALEGQFDTAWNCAFVIYEDAAKATPEGEPVVIKSANYKPCINQAWQAAFQLLATVRAFKPDFLTKAVTVSGPAGTQFHYVPITSETVPEALPLAPAKPIKF